MALTRELKDYIISSYDKKIKVLKAEQVKAECNLLTKRKKELNTEFDPIISDCRKVIRQTSEWIKSKNLIPSSYFHNLLTYDAYTVPNSLITNDPEIQPFLNKVISLEKERYTLLIKLSLEKDFDRINEMLKQAGIALI